MPTGRAGAASIPPDVVDYLLHVGQLCRIQPSNLKVESVLLPQQETVLTEKRREILTSISMEGRMLSFSQFDTLCLETESRRARST
ncbi:MAG: hypothetical protein PUH08_05920 [Treponema sp.]|nr:hypothetical protein [Treponema sp.]MDY3755351.1 hypothetical protein [Treponema sp.]